MKVSIKQIKRNRLNKKLVISLLNEIAVLKELEHPNVIRLYDVEVIAPL